MTRITNLSHNLLKHFGVFLYICTISNVRSIPLPMTSVHFGLESPQDDTLASNVLGSELSTFNSNITSVTPITSVLTFPGPSEERQCKPNLAECGVPKQANFLCGSDGKTYKNLDEFNCYRKSCKPDLTIQSLGLCIEVEIKKAPVARTNKSASPVTPVFSVPVEQSNSIKVNKCNPDACGCSDEFVPNCGTDGITYGNVCLLKCNQKCNPDVTLFHEGYCGKIFFRDNKEFQTQKSKVSQVVFNLV